MNKKVITVSAITIVLICVIGYGVLFAMSVLNKSKLVGVWEDSTGYAIEFKDTGYYRESLYCKDMKFSLQGGVLEYAWADGSVYKTNVEFLFGNRISLQFNGEQRIMLKSNHDVLSYSWKLPDIESGDSVYKKYNSVSNTINQSTIYLLSSGKYSWVYNSSDSDWRSEGEGRMLGIYADGDGQTVLYYDGGNECEVFKKFDGGTYLATDRMRGTIKSINTTYSSPVDKKGFILVGDFVDAISGMQYHFYNNGILIAETDDKAISYSYIVSNDGLVTLSAIDAYNVTDYFFFDVNEETLYRLVFKKDSWADYMSSIDAGSGEITSEPIASNAEELLCEYRPYKSDGIVYLVSNDNTVTNKIYNEIVAQQKHTEQQIETTRILLEQQEEAKQQEMEMLTDLAKQKKEADMELARQAVGILETARRNGDDNPVVVINGKEYHSREELIEDRLIDPDYIYLVEDEQEIDTADESETDAEKTKRYSIYVAWIDNCRDDREDDYPVPEHTEIGAVVNGKFFNIGDTLRIHSNDAEYIVPVVAIDSTLDTGIINVYVSSHDNWANLDSGYTLVELLE